MSQDNLRADRVEAEATARLIAAAPELLEALERAEKHVKTSCLYSETFPEWHEDLRLLQAAIAKATTPTPSPAMGEWQPIASAPKDGEAFLAGRWANGFLADQFFFRGISWWEDGAFHEVAGHAPTHWQPLPEPPDQSDG